MLHGINLFSFDEERNLTRVLTAERAIYQRNQWQMQNVRDVNVTPQILIENDHDTLEWDTGLTPDRLSVVMIEPRDMSISDLYQYAVYIGNQGLNADNYLLSFWRKVLQPLSTFALVLLGVSFIFGPLRQVTAGSRIFTGILVGLVYKYMEEMLAPASIVLGFAPILASVIPIAVSALVGFYLLRKAG